MSTYRHPLIVLIALLIMAGAACQSAPAETPTVTTDDALTRQNSVLATTTPAPTETPLPPLAGAAGDVLDADAGAEDAAGADAADDEAADGDTASDEADDADEREDDTATISGDTWYVTGGLRINIRACPAENCRVVMYADPGDPVTVLSTQDNWHRIRLEDGTIAYIAAWVTRQQPPLR